jgi:pimeloyl-ACP methyl ester carboxylesterase
MIERRHLQLEGLRLSYLEQGTAAQDKPSLVLLHGLMGCAETFVPLMNELSGRHVIALDLPGAGLSERRPDIDATLAATTTNVADFLTALDLRQPVLVGHSHGGTVALSLAAKHRKILRSIVLLAPAHPYFDEGAPVIRFYLSLPGRIFAHSMPWYPQWLQMMGLRRMAGPQSWDTPERLKPYRENLRMKGTMAHLLKLLRSWQTDMSALHEALQDPLSLPTLILWGDSDRAVPANSGVQLREHLLRSELHILPGVGHRPAEERAAVVAGYLADWQDQTFIAQEPVRYSANSSAAQLLTASLMKPSLEAGD